MVWRYDSSGKAPALQAQSPEFEAQAHQKKKRKYINQPQSVKEMRS
jgi:hypothetical protein